MTLADRTRAAIDRRLARLRDTYGDFAVEQERVTNDPDYFAHGRDLVGSGVVGDAGAWVTDDDGRALLVRHEGAPHLWGTPGGGHEPGETLEETARREVREETGIECELTGVYWARRKVAVHEDDPERRFQLLTVEFEADSVGGEIEIGDEEILAARWFTEPPEQVHGIVAPKVDEWADG